MEFFVTYYCYRFNAARMKKGILLISLALLCSFCTQRKAIHITEISQQDLNNAYLIDVRTPKEFQEGHLDNAININWFDPDFQQQVRALEKDKKIYVYCKKGGRSMEAAAVLDSLGFKVIDLTGGYDAYTAEQLP